MMRLALALALSGITAAQKDGMAGGSDGSEEVNCCGGGAACGHVYCPALASSSDGCMAVWDITGMGMTMDDCTAPQIAIDPMPPVMHPTDPIVDPGFVVDPGFGIAVDPSFGIDTSIGVAAGGRCASGFCEDPSNCPQCAAGLSCQVPADMMCAGTCFGTCVEQEQDTTPPEGCTTWFDGCNTCVRDSPTDAFTCTYMMCGPWSQPAECQAYAAGYDGHRRAQLMGGGNDDHNCCGGGAACGHVYCPALASTADGCMAIWSLPAGADFTKDCGVAAPTPAPAPPIIAVDPGFGMVPLQDNSIGAPNGCMTWNDGCNTCTRFDLTDSFSCTEMACLWQGEPSCMDEAAAVEGERCAASTWCESSDCPQCASGLTCHVTAMMCAGTCYGTCVAGGH